MKYRCNLLLSSWKNSSHRMLVLQMREILQRDYLTCSKVRKSCSRESWARKAGLPGLLHPRGVFRTVEMQPQGKISSLSLDLFEGFLTSSAKQSC